MTPQIMLAKLTAPQPGSVFTRKRLFNQLDTMTQHPVNWISAPAGSGKTTLILSYLIDRKIKPLWFQIDEGDSDLAAFFYHLKQLAQQTSPEKSALPLLTAEYLQNIPAFAANFFRAFYAQLPDNTVLVFDNFQDAGASNPLVPLLPIMFHDIPPNIQLIMISRSMPPNELAQLLNSEQVQTMNWQHLQFTEDEVAGLSKLYNPDDTLSKTDVSNLHNRTQGWVASLIQMLAHHFDTAYLKSINFNQSQTALFNCFANEIFQQTDTGTKNFLLKTAFLNKIKTSNAEQLTGNKNSLDLLLKLSQQNYFTTRHSENDQCFEYHALFREFLKKQAEKHLSTDDIRHIKTQVSNLLLADKQYNEAVQLLISLQAWEQLSALICQQAMPYCQTGQWKTIASWIDSLPDEYIENNPWLLFWRGTSKQVLDIFKAREDFRRAYHLFKKQADLSGIYLSWSAAVDTYFIIWLDFKPLDYWIEELHMIQTQFPTFPNIEIEARIVSSMIGSLIWRQPGHKNMSQWCERGEALLLSDINPTLRIMIAFNLSLFYFWFQGNLLKGRAITEIVQPLSDSLNVNMLGKLVWKIKETVYFYFNNEGQKAVESANGALALADESGVHIIDVRLHAQATYAYLSIFDTEQATQQLEKMKDLMKDIATFDAAQYYYLSAWAVLNNNNTALAMEYIIRGEDFANKNNVGASNYKAFCSMTKAHIFVEQGRLKEAREMLATAKQWAELVNHQLLHCYFHLIEAYMAILENNFDACKRELQSGLVLAKHQGYVMLPWIGWRKPLMIRLYQFALEHEIETEYVQQVVNERHLVPDDSTIHIDSWPYPVKIYTLGRFRVLINNNAIEANGKTQKKPLELLKALIALGGRDVRDDQLTEILWPDAEGDAAYSNLKTTVNRLRKLLANKQAITFIEGKLNLDQKYCWLDCWAFEHMIEKTDNTDAQLEKILAIYRGNFFTSEADNHWLLAPRERLRRKFINAIVTLGEHHEQQKHWTSAIDIYLKGLHTDDLVEIFYQGLIRCYNTLGNQSEAIRTYQQCDETLQSQLSVKPSALTEKLLTEIRGKS